MVHAHAHTHAIAVFEGHGPVLLRVYTEAGPQPAETVSLTPDQAVALARELLGLSLEARAAAMREAFQ